jgi:penicillin-binding protein 2
MKSQRFIREKQPVRRIVTLSLFVSAVFFLLFTRLWYLQILKTESFRDLSENNRLRFLPVAASRGGILDRNGKELVKNRPSFSVAVIQKDVQDKDALLDRLAKILKVERKELEEKWEKGKGRAKYYPIVLASGISRDQLEVLEENNLSLPGVNIEMKPVREYTNGILAAHLLGPIGEITEADLGSDDFQEYNAGDYVGKSGIERSWEHDLHGADGGRQIEVDALGRVLRNIRESRPVMGNTLILTIDKDLDSMAFLDTGMSALAIMLAARARGLDTCAQGAWNSFWSVTREVLKVPDDQYIVCGLSLGWADPAHPVNNLVAEREPLESFATFHGF